MDKIFMFFEGLTRQFNSRSIFYLFLIKTTLFTCPVSAANRVNENYENLTNDYIESVELYLDEEKNYFLKGPDKLLPLMGDYGFTTPYIPPKSIFMIKDNGSTLSHHTKGKHRLEMFGHRNWIRDGSYFPANDGSYLIKRDLNLDGQTDLLIILAAQQTLAAFISDQGQYQAHAFELQGDVAPQLIYKNDDGLVDLVLGQDVYLTNLSGDFTYHQGSSANIHHDPDATIPDPNSTRSHQYESTAGSFRVNESGQATYSIPFTLPPGIAGVQPSLGLGYHSAGGHGHAGWGWNITGIAAITRCHADYIHDGYQQGVLLSEVDTHQQSKFCMDGQRLIPTGDQTYQKELTDFSIITAIRDPYGQRVIGFEVQTKSNETHYYGEVETPFYYEVNGQITQDGMTTIKGKMPGYDVVTSYLLKGIRDQFGNYISFRYVADGQSNGHKILKEVAYGGNDLKKIPPANRVEFQYKERQSKTFGYRHNNRIQSTKVLSAVRVLQDGHSYRYYEINHNERDKHRDLVTHVRECIQKDNQCRLPIQFNMLPEVDAGIATRARKTYEASPDAYQYQFLDLNGDLRTDILEIPVEPGKPFYYRLGWNGDRKQIDNIDKPEVIQLIDHDQDGKTDVLYMVRGWWHIASFGGNDHDIKKTSLQDSVDFRDGRVTVSDVDGDADLDLVYVVGLREIHAHINNYGKFETSSTLLTNQLEGVVEVNDILSGSADFNGDGVNDLALKTRILYQPENTNRIIVLLSHSPEKRYKQVYLGDISKYSQIQFTDINRDGLTDVLKNSDVEVTYHLSYGTKFSEHIQLEQTMANSGIQGVLLIDVDNDFKPELLISHRETNEDLVLQVADVYSRQGDYFAARNKKEILRHNRGGSSGQFVVSPVDTNLDGHLELMVTSTVAKKIYHFDNLASGKNANKPLHSIIEGYSPDPSKGPNIETQIKYRIMSDPTIYKRAWGETNHEYISRISPRWLVSDVKGRRNGRSLIHDYQYEKQLFHRHGLGNLGFRKIISRNRTKGLTTEITFSQRRYSVGMPIHTQQYWYIDNTVLGDTSSNNYDLKEVKPNIYFLYTKSSNEVSRRFGSDKKNRIVGKTFTTTDVDLWGNPTKVTSWRYNGEYLNTMGGLILKTTTRNKYSNPRRGLLSETTVEKYQPAYSIGGLVNQPESKQVRRSLFTHHPAGSLKAGLLASRTTRPGTEQEKVTSYDYDDYGNQTYTAVRTIKDGTRTSLSKYSENGRYVSWTQDSLGFKTHYLYNGVQASQVNAPIFSLTKTSPYKLISRTFYNTFGKSISKHSPDGRIKRVVRDFCQSNCRSALYQETTKISGQGEVTDYYDRYGQKVIQRSQLLDGTFAYSRSEFDEFGRLVLSYEPTRNIGVFNHVRYLYDHRSRVIDERHSSGQVKKFGYYGLVKEIQYPGQVPGEHRFAQTVTTSTGKTLATYSPIHQSRGATLNDQAPHVAHQYNVSGQLTNSTTYVLDSNTTSPQLLSYTVNVAYDELGRKIKTDDPEKGIWTYKYDAFDQLTKQVDANGNIKSIAYDQTGRVVQTTELSPNQELRLTCHTFSEEGLLKRSALHFVSQANHPISCQSLPRLVQTQQEVSYDYDQFHRKIRTYASYPSESLKLETLTEYDTYGRPSVLTYPNGLRIRNVYAINGQVRGIQNAETGELYSHIDSVDAHGRVTSETLFGNVSRNYGFDSERGWLKDIQVRSSVHGDIYQASYEYFDNGNTKKRTSHYYDDKAVNGTVTPILSLNEQFTYDPLHERLTSRDVSFETRFSNEEHEIASSENYQYDGFGNLTYKSGTGHYKYHDASRPHRLSQVNGVASSEPTRTFTYDAVGNIVKETGVNHKETTYTSFHKPSQIETDKAQTTFKYGLGYARYFRKDEYRFADRTFGSQTTIYYGKSYERVSTKNMKDEAGQNIPDTQWENYYIGSLVIKRYADRRPDTIRVRHIDTLGSTTAITDENGQVVSQSMYDPFGKQHAVVRSNTLIDQVQPIEGRRGFTGHENIDEADLIHMNGRIYDPSLGRFLQADPIIQAPNNTQNYNRYSYVLNNPMRYTDPSGYSFFDRMLRPAKKLIRGAMKKIGIKASTWLVNIGSAFCGPWYAACVAVGNYDIARAFGAPKSGALRAGATSGALAYIGQQANAQWGTRSWQSVATQATAGGLAADLNGGKFAHGFLSAGFNASQQGPSYGANYGANLGSLSDYAGSFASYLMNSYVQDEVGRFANKNGMTSAELNIYLSLLSYGGNQLTGSRYRGETDGIERIDGLGRRFGWIGGDSARSAGFNPYGVIFDFVDITLGYQGYFSASSRQYVSSGDLSAPLMGYSLGALDANVLASKGFGWNGVTAVSLPFGNVGVPGVSVINGTSDPVNGGWFGYLFTPSAMFVDRGLSCHLSYCYSALGTRGWNP